MQAPEGVATDASCCAEGTNADTSQTAVLGRLLDMDAENTPSRDPALPTPSERVWAEFLIVLDALPPSARAAFMLHEVFGASYDDISALLGLPPPACRQQVELARACAREHARSIANPARTP
ncbi:MULTISPECIES: sigma factor-like helix-turn-helix DNA-binding protein [unclassified Lysobacter]|uniref:sigma factor-like helix-turn-helix DNA-binding protein n=1 Tax=unclassified Lysobacter TaxID=2635362 RepID=UPI001C232ABC|nr:sigma factor-like helix-turn-helix DNA-binding protein [Lysobacter sp. MMG2]MBU8977829.1 hypothetical protein [Lysobacter sp. MMG2]